MKRIVLGMLFLTLLMPANCVSELSKKHEVMENPLKKLLRIGKSLALIAWSNPIVKIAASCLPDLYCYYEHFNDPTRYTECAWYLIKCIFKHVKGITTCLYDLGGDVFIMWYYHGHRVEDYDFFKIALDILACAGADQWTIYVVKKNLFG